MKKPLRLLTLLLTSFLLTGCVTITNSNSNSGDDTADTTSVSGDDSSNSGNSVTSIDSDETVHVTSVSLNETSKSLTVGDTFTLKATVLPENASNKNVSYASKNSSVVLVNNSGLVTALKAGSTSVIVTTEDGSKTATCSFTVASKSDPTPEVIHVTSVSLNVASKSLTVGDTFTLSATVLPNNASDKSVSFTSSNSSVASVASSGLVTALSAGTTTIKVTTIDGNKTASCQVNVTKKTASNQVVINSNNTSKNTNNQITALDEDDFTFEGTGITKFEAECSNVYPSGDTSYKFSSSKKGGSLTISFDKILIKGISLSIASYGDKNTSVKVATSSNTSGQSMSLDSENKKEYTYSTFSTSASECTSITISSSAQKRFYLYSITLTLGAVDPIYPIAISLPSTYNLALNGSETLTPTVSPTNYNQGNISWNSNDASTVSVNNGVITGLKEGSATITASINNESGLSLTASCSVTVSPIKVTGVSLNESSISLTVNKTKSLVATVLPSNASNKSVTFSSSNSSVASVNGSGVITANKIGTAVIKVTTADGGYTASCNVSVIEQVLDAWTIMIYMCGSDLESENGLATSDLDEILSVSNKPSNVNIIIETGGAKSWESKYSISANYLERWEVKNSKLNKVASLTKASMGKPSTFQSFMEWGLTNYPADRTGVILWNHGGALDGVCYDENYRDYLENYETESVLSSLNLSSKLEWIGYDACLMQVQDVAMVNSKYFNYMVASQESESGYGWDYDSWLPSLYNNPESVETGTVLKSIVDSFINDNGGVSGKGSYYQGHYYLANQTLSYLNLSYMNEYYSAWETLASQLSNKVTSSNASSFRTSIIGKTKYFADSYYGEGYYSDFSVFDVYHFLTILSNNSTFSVSAISDVKSAFNNLVAYSSVQTEGAKDAHGLSFFFDITSRSYYKTNSQNNQFPTWDTFWKNYCGSTTSTYYYNS